MYIIYKATNLLTNKVYIGQTKNFEQRKRNHKSESFNIKANGYKLPFHCAIRKYGWDNFSWEILEEIPDEENTSYVDERERFFIEEFHSLKDDKGYNVTLGGQGNPRPKLSYEENLRINSKLFTADEIKDIQKCLLEDWEYGDILEKYSPKLTASFLSNINCGYNYKNPEWTYPLRKENQSHILSKKQQKEIKEMLKAKIVYSEIEKKFNISKSLVSMINTGKVFFDPEEKYPLCNKGCRKEDNQWWVDLIIKEITSSNLTLKEISEKYQKGYATVKNINSGRSHKEEKLFYPLNKNKEKNLSLI